MKTKLVSLLLFICTTVQAQNVTDIINGVLGGNSSSNEMVSNLTSVFSKNKQATQDKLIGTWSYTEPAIVFTSDNILAKVGSKIAANKLENKIQEYLTRYGIKPGAFTMTFNEDGNTERQDFER